MARSAPSARAAALLFAIPFVALTAEGGGARARARSTEGVVTLRPPTEGRVLVRGSVFTMGSDESEIALAIALCQAEPAGEACKVDWFADEITAHPVQLGDYWIDRAEVSMGDFLRCARAGPCEAAPLAAGGKRFESPELPANMVTWSDAASYCRWRGGRLPTEAEWERAARGTEGRRYPWGNVFDPRFANGGRFGIDALEDRDGFLELAPVGSFVHGRTPDGIADLGGNVEEWVADWYAPEYPEASELNPKGPGVGDLKVVRGGSYFQARAWLRGAKRGHDLPSARRPWRGFRCAYDG